MTPEKLAEIRQRAEKATGGPWKVGHIDHSNPLILQAVEHGLIVVGFEPSDGNAEHQWLVEDADAAFIAHAREDVPLLIAALLDAYEDAQRLRCVHCSQCGKPRESEGEALYCAHCLANTLDRVGGEWRDATAAIVAVEDGPADGVTVTFSVPNDHDGSHEIEAQGGDVSACAQAFIHAMRLPAGGSR